MTDQQPSTSAKSDKLPYPYGIPFILGNEFCERFNFYGMRSKFFLVLYLYFFFQRKFFLAILTLYFVQKFKYSEDEATKIYHTAYASIFVMGLIGGIIADNFIGKYHTIWSGSCFYVLGTVCLAISAVPGVNGAIGLRCMSLCSFCFLKQLTKEIS